MQFGHYSLNKRQQESLKTSSMGAMKWCKGCGNPKFLTCVSIQKPAFKTRLVVI